MSTGVRYLLYQIPGWIAAGLLAFAAWRLGWMPGWLAASLALLWVVKDGLLYRFVRAAYRREPDVSEAVVGEEGVVVRTLAPRAGKGLVRIGNELFRAESDGTIAEGVRVVVTGARGLVLTVRPL